MADLVFILNGPNLNLLGKREPEVYGKTTLAEIEAEARKVGAELELEIDFRQTNAEGELVDWIQEAGTAGGLILNPGAYGHTSIALHDALRGVGVPTVEVHLSNIFARERFRRHSYVSAVAAGVITGFGPNVYSLGLNAIARLIRG